MKVPVFIINGFLDAGKTQFILSTIRRDQFYQRGKTLLLVCEEGENEYDENELLKYKTTIMYLKEENLNASYLDELYKKHSPDRIVMEMNLMHDQQNISFPRYFEVAQYITLIDGLTFPVYYNNMRQKFTDVIKLSDVVAFTKLQSRDPLASYQTGLKVTNSQCLYCLINEDCISTEQAFVAPLPYDKNKEEIIIEDNDFGDFYIDTFDNRPDYDNKIVIFNAWVVKSEKLKDNEFIAGRKVLNCCTDDIQLFGFLAISSFAKDLQHDSWIRIKARCKIEFNEEYDEEEIILYPLEIKPIKEIKNPILDLR